ncbi:GNAT family N-acetyltransferase [Brevibacillus centrosporus]|uniref:GNAT family N-acetyltransferase n=1 Tax=Brevibacillus centrosporus TaxID=54910 RepID=UPI000B8653A1|nr:GNAT family N-acetyltransferase [Brevibacillus centrosporus]MED4907461.1 GNAT family N-acetyltransferase [Brevibacillus centrosporus]
MFLQHIAVRAASREHGYGSQLIDLLIQKYKSKVIAAKTDQEAFGFYRKYGFQIKSLGEKYPGVERFLCVYYV